MKVQRGIYTLTDLGRSEMERLLTEDMFIRHRKTKGTI